MADIDHQFAHVCYNILSSGREYVDKSRDVTRKQITSHTVQHNLSHGFPAITNKKLPFKFVKGELIWFLRGDTNIKYLVDNKIPIWDKDAYNMYVKVVSLDTEKAQSNMYIWNEGTCRMFTIEEFIQSIRSSYSIVDMKRHKSFGDYTLGDVGRNYSAQWRDYRGEAIGYHESTGVFMYERVDQIKNLIRDMRDNIMSTRLKVNAWNPAELDKTALPPCHDGFQIIGVPLTVTERVACLMKLNIDLLSDDFKKACSLVDETSVKLSVEDAVAECDKHNIPEFGFELHWNQRSVDTFLGLPFNIASYGSLTHVLAEITGYVALSIEGALKCVHLYDNQYDAIKEMRERDVNNHPDCELVFSENFKLDCKAFQKDELTLDELFDRLSIDSFKLKGYTSDEAINVEMLAPKSI